MGGGGTQKLSCYVNITSFHMMDDITLIVIPDATSVARLLCNPRLPAAKDARSYADGTNQFAVQNDNCYSNAVSRNLHKYHLKMPQANSCHGSDQRRDIEHVLLLVLLSGGNEVSLADTLQFSFHSRGQGDKGT